MTSFRCSGILLHPTSLPGPHGSGDLGPAAFHFVDWLATGRQALWQVLPLGGIGPGNSPYMSPSAFAGNELLIDLARLRDAGWLTGADIDPSAPFRDDRVDYGRVRPFRVSRLRLAAERFFADARESARRDYLAFCHEESGWLEDYALFKALESKLAPSGKVWQDLPAELVQRKAKALREAARSLADECDFWRFCQWCFDRQWAALKKYANERGVSIVGDVPIFVSAHSADVWARQRLFDLDDRGYPRVVAGVPPDYFSATGQRWGNPLYRWEEHERDAFHWWTERMRRMLKLCDVVRIDHFRGFESCWEIPAASPTAAEGQWRKGPGQAFFAEMRKNLGLKRGGKPGGFRIIAEDLGVITPEVAALRQAAGFPGMRILQFAFDGQSGNPYLPHNFEPQTVVYTGTHDNDTTRGWWKSLPEQQRHYVRRYLGVDGASIHWDMIRAASASVAAASIVPAQDVLGLDSSARMNRPGVAEGYWEWRFTWDQFAPWHAERLAELAQLHGRIPLRAPGETPPAAS
ncbi:MAG: 4-alpha-glucanotransferase [Candidatus Accumulibacter sp.]|jgi:4-alpha-glucanotransferase|nr:4-alpha-glucanotransferase [Accumulibacter sp.]